MYKRQTLDVILKAGEYSPSGMGQQSTLMVVTQDPDLVAKLSRMNAAVMGSKSDPFYGAPTVIIVFSDSKMGTCVENGSLVMGNLMNAAHALGVDSFACDAAVLSYMAGYEEPKEYIMQNDIRIADRLIDAGHYEEIIKCLPLFKDCTVKLIDAMTQNSDNTMLRAYLLEYMKEDKTDFDI